MAFRLDRRNRLTYGMQVQRQALAQLIAGRLRPGDRFPSVRKLARDLGISRTTGERIQSLLCASTLAEVRPRSGVFVTSPEDLARRQHLLYARSVYDFLKETTTRARALGIDAARLAALLRAVDEPDPDGTGLASFPIVATRDWYECMVACLAPGFPARLVHLQPNARTAQLPADARYLLSSYCMRGRAREIAHDAGRTVIYVRYNVTLLDRAMTFASTCDRKYFVTRDHDNADTTRQFLASAYPEVAASRYTVLTAREFLALPPPDRDPRTQIWATITAAPLLGRVPRERLELLHPLMADDFIEELTSLALVC